MKNVMKTLVIFPRLLPRNMVKILDQHQVFQADFTLKTWRVGILVRYLVNTEDFSSGLQDK
jgi:hypothetical protein